MTTVFVLQHVARQDQPDEDVKFIGVYSNRQLAIAATNALKNLPGFRDYPNGFHIDEYQVNQNHWTDGFVS
jgi:hypothetical protein